MILSEAVFGRPDLLSITTKNGRSDPTREKLQKLSQIYTNETKTLSSLLKSCSLLFERRKIAVLGTEN